MNNNSLTGILIIIFIIFIFLSLTRKKTIIYEQGFIIDEESDDKNYEELDTSAHELYKNDTYCIDSDDQLVIEKFFNEHIQNITDGLKIFSRALLSIDLQNNNTVDISFEKSIININVNVFNGKNKLRADSVLKKILDEKFDIDSEYSTSQILILRKNLEILNCKILSSIVLNLINIFREFIEIDCITVEKSFY